MLPTDVLRNEHKIVILVLQGAEKEAKSIIETGIVNETKIRKIIDFTRNFTDGCHHAKEEKHLFPKLGERGFSKDPGPVAVMLMEHEDGRRLTSAVEKNLELVISGNNDALASLAKSLAGYANLLKNHISKEDNVLFNMADGVLTDSDKIELLDAFEKVETEETGEGIHEKYHKIAHEIAGI